MGKIDGWLEEVSVGEIVGSLEGVSIRLLSQNTKFCRQKSNSLTVLVGEINGRLEGLFSELEEEPFDPRSDIVALLFVPSLPKLK